MLFIIVIVGDLLKLSLCSRLHTEYCFTRFFIKVRQSLYGSLWFITLIMTFVINMVDCFRLRLSYSFIDAVIAYIYISLFYSVFINIT